MAEPVVLSDQVKAMTATCTEFATSDSQLLVIISQKANEMHARHPLQEIKFTAMVQAKTYRYQVTDKNGKIWKQKIRMDIETDPGMVFEHTGEWRPSEFNPHLAVRLAILNAVQGLKLRKLVITFA